MDYPIKSKTIPKKDIMFFYQFHALIYLNIVVLQLIFGALFD